jgi:hypothetical protein
MLKNTLIFGVSCFILGCSSTAYHQKKGSSGYSETQLSDTQFKAAYSYRGYLPIPKIEDYSFLRAAELTLEYGFTHFEILDLKYTPPSYISQTEPMITTSADGTSSVSYITYDVIVANQRVVSSIRCASPTTKAEQEHLIDARTLSNQLKQKYEITQ